MDELDIYSAELSVPITHSESYVVSGNDPALRIDFMKAALQGLLASGALYKMSQEQISVKTLDLANAVIKVLKQRK